MNTTCFPQLFDASVGKGDPRYIYQGQGHKPVLEPTIKIVMSEVNYAKLLELLKDTK